MFKAIFWDNDGVLVDTEKLYFQATQEIMTAAGVPLSEADYLEYFLRQDRGAWHLLAERGTSPDEIVSLRQARNDLAPRIMPRRLGTVLAIKRGEAAGSSTDVKVARALLSVSDKTGLAELGRALARHAARPAFTARAKPDQDCTCMFLSTPA